MPKLGRGLGLANLPNRILEVYLPSSSGPAGNIYTSPSEVGSAVTIQSVSPFTGGGFSYLFTESVNSYLDLPPDQSWALGTGDYTIEWFSYQTPNTAGYQRVFTVDDYNSIDIGVSIENGSFYYWANNNAGTLVGSTGANTWYHWAVVRLNGVTRIYRNGTQFGSQITDTNNIVNTTDPLSIGNENASTTQAAFKGYITNFRWVKGLAVYTGSFTVPTSELTLTAGANPYGGSNTQAIPAGYTKLLLVPTTTETYRIVTGTGDSLITNNNDYIIYGT